MLGTTDPQAELLDSQSLCGHLVAEDSIYAKLAALGDRLFTDEDFSDLFDPTKGRPSVPPSLLAKVLLLQSLEGTSDRETTDRLRCDLRWKVALGLPLQYEGFHPTVLCYFRERLRKSDSPRRIFDRFKQIAEQAGLISKKGIRVLDSTPVLSAVQAQDTISLIRGALRRLIALLAKCDPKIKDAVEAVLQRTDYADPGKPAIDWDDERQRADLVDELVKDAHRATEVLSGHELPDDARQASELLATVAGQDVEHTDDGRFVIRRGVAKGRVVSVVDPDVRHGRKTSSGPFNGFKAGIAIDPETELITEVNVGSARSSDSEMVEDLVPELKDAEGDSLTIVADSAYGSGETRKMLAEANVATVIKPSPENNSTGGFPKSAFKIDLENRKATCPAGVTTDKAFDTKDGGIRFVFPAATCASCLLRAQCTSSPNGRQVATGPNEVFLSQARRDFRTEPFKQVYNSKRPTVERVIYRLVRNGGRKARYRGMDRVCEQSTLKAAAENLARMLTMGLQWTDQKGWVVI